MSKTKEQALFSPEQVFTHPNEILEDSVVPLTHEEKIKALNTWLYDIQQHQIADEENMATQALDSDLALEEAIHQALTVLSKG